MNKRFLYTFLTLFVFALLIAALTSAGFWGVGKLIQEPLSLKMTLLGFFISFIVVGSVLFLRVNQLHNRIEKLYVNVVKRPLDKQLNTIDYLDQLIEKIDEEITEFGEEIDILTERENFRRDFLGDISHELKTPLFSIQGYTLTLIEGGVEDIEIRDKYLDRINKSVERLIYIVEDLDLIAEIEDPDFSITSQPFNIVAVGQEVFDLLELKAEKNSVFLQLDKNYDSIKVLGDYNKIRQVLINLIVNAIRYSQKEGAIVTLSFKNAENNLLKISISDNGKGIEKEYLNRIFERFYRVDRSRSRASGGSGLGLSIVKHIVEAHGQKVYVKSKPDVETTFYFYLKLA